MNDCGPKTIKGKERSRLNALKTGRFSKILGDLSCDYCKRKEFCQYYSPNSKCGLRGALSKKILVDNLDVTTELKELYKISLTRGLELLALGSAESTKWFNLATKQLEILKKQDFKEEDKTCLINLEVDKIFDDYLKEKKRRQLEEI